MKAVNAANKKPKVEENNAVEQPNQSKTKYEKKMATNHLVGRDLAELMVDLSSHRMRIEATVTKPADKLRNATTRTVTLDWILCDVYLAQSFPLIPFCASRADKIAL
jgi:hypothetical protein